MTAKVVVELDGLSRAEWLKARRGGIGSSDAPALFGLSRYDSPTSLFLDKTQGDDEGVEDAGERARFGGLLEDVIAQEFESKTGLLTSKPQAMYASDAHPFMYASPDRFTGQKGETNATGVLELKTYTGHGDRWDDGPPHDVIVQLQHQLVVVERDQGYVAVLKHGWEFHWWPVNLDRSIADTLVEVEAEFWSHVQNGTPPPADGHDATTAALQKLYGTVEEGSVIDLSHLHETFRERVDAAARVDAAKAALAEIDNRIKAELGEHETGLYHGAPFVTWKPTAEFDEAAFVADHPDLAAEFSKVQVGALEKAGHRDLAKQYRRERAGSRRFAFKR